MKDACNVDELCKRTRMIKKKALGQTVLEDTLYKSQGASYD